jgi:hypothetical protein
MAERFLSLPVSPPSSSASSATKENKAICAPNLSATRPKDGPNQDSPLKDAFRIRHVRGNIKLGMNAVANPVFLSRVAAPPARHDFA